MEISHYCDITAYSRFYIGCDRCQDWFHGSCVGITKSEADKLDTYICPNCQKSRDSMVTTKLITDRGRAELKRLINQLQVQYHTLSHPRTPRVQCYIHKQSRSTRVATAQGKQGIWFLLFPDRENTGNLVLTQGKYLDCDY